MTLEQIIDLISKWITDKKTGSIKINFFKGGISNANLTECVKGDTLSSQKCVKLIKK